MERNFSILYIYRSIATLRIMYKIFATKKCNVCPNKIVKTWTISVSVRMRTISEMCLQ